MTFNSLCMYIFFSLMLFFSRTHIFCICSYDKGVNNRLDSTSRQEVFAFLNGCKKSVWEKFDWAKLTTIATSDCFDQEFISFSHRHNVKVVVFGTYPVNELLNGTQQINWLLSKLKLVLENGLDGLNIDFEDPLIEKSREVEALTQLAVDAARLFHASLPQSQVSFDVAWSPNCTDGRCYDYLALSQAVDFVFVMSYDEQSQMFEQQCKARANSGMEKTRQGLKELISLGVLPYKMILGVPWYGYDYSCLHGSQNNTCLIEEVPFRGVNCSDAAGRQIQYSVITESLLKQSPSGRQWDEQQQSPFFNYLDATTGANHQVWYDDVESLRLKYNLVAEMGLRGAGMWSAEQLDYSDTEQARVQRDAMWGALPPTQMAKRYEVVRAK